MTRNPDKRSERFECVECGHCWQYVREPQVVKQQDDGSYKRVSGDPPRPQNCPECDNHAGTDGVSFRVASVNGVGTLDG